MIHQQEFVHNAQQHFIMYYLYMHLVILMYHKQLLILLITLEVFNHVCLVIKYVQHVQQSNY
jgi:hypothetical protein